MVIAPKMVTVIIKAVSPAGSGMGLEEEGSIFKNVCPKPLEKE